MAELESLETAAEHERILREIESTDTACIGPTLRYGPGGAGAAGGAGPGGLRAGSEPLCSLCQRSSCAEGSLKGRFVFPWWRGAP